MYDILFFFIIYLFDKHGKRSALSIHCIVEV